MLTALLNSIDVPVPDGVANDWRIETFEISPREASFSSIRAIMHPEERVEAGTYKRLMHRNEVIMSNTRMEIRTNRPIILAAKGRTLLNGLGLGMVPAAILKKPELTELWVVEKSPDVIQLVGPTFASDSRVRIIEDDAFDYQPPKGVRFDAVWHDIWDNICADNLAEMTRLTRKYSRRADWQGCWARVECLRAKRRWG